MESSNVLASKTTPRAAAQSTLLAPFDAAAEAGL